MNQQKKSKKKTIIIAVVVVLFLGAIASNARDDDTKNETEVSNTTSTTETSSDNASQTAAPGKDSSSETKEKTKEEPKKDPKKEKSKFISSCKSYEYKKLARYPEKYKDKHITVKVKVAQIVNGGLFDDSVYYRCYTKGAYDTWFENEFFIIDDREGDTTKILEDDILTVYGTYSGTEDVERSLTNTTESVPAISMKYCKIKE